MGNRRKVILRADAGPSIGYGHFVRSLALADILHEEFDCLIVTQTPTQYQRQEVVGICPLVALPADERKFSLFLDMLDGSEIVVLDNYFYDTVYQQCIREKGCVLVCIDDIHDKHYVADALINHTPKLSTDSFDVEVYTRLCLGLDYALLRREFLDQCETNRSKVTPTMGIQNDVFVCFGGTDYNNITSRVVEAVAGRWPVFAVIGDAFAGQLELEHLASRFGNVSIHRNLSAAVMATAIAGCRLAVVPASSIFLESLFMGAPCLFGYYVDNQREAAEQIGTDEKLGVHFIGDWNSISIDKIGQEINQMMRREHKPFSMCKWEPRDNLMRLFTELASN